MVSAVEEARRLHGPLEKPVFLVTDNGPSFIAQRFRDALAGIQIAGTGLSAFSMLTVRPFTVASFSHNAHDTLPARDFFTGSDILFHLGGLF